jgi:23S rRNA pseudouridine955/2504/2580 synthase
MNPLPALFENQEIIVVNKPSGLAVQGGKGIVHSVDTVLAAQTGGKVYPVHRLDRDTAGVLVVAKTRDAARFWAGLFASHGVVKEYEALCVGTLPQAGGLLSTPAGKKGREKEALTEYRVLALSETEPVFSFLGLRLRTGRTHQIRIHLADALCPVAADDKYGDFTVNRAIRAQFGIKKLQLAAVRLTLPVDGKPLTLEAPLPEHIAAAVERVLGRPY